MRKQTSRLRRGQHRSEVLNPNQVNGTVAVFALQGELLPGAGGMEWMQEAASTIDQPAIRC